MTSLTERRTSFPLGHREKSVKSEGKIYERYVRKKTGSIPAKDNKNRLQSIITLSILVLLLTGYNDY